MNSLGFLLIIFILCCSSRNDKDISPCNEALKIEETKKQEIEIIEKEIIILGIEEAIIKEELESMIREKEARIEEERQGKRQISIRLEEGQKILEKRKEEIVKEMNILDSELRELELQGRTEEAATKRLQLMRLERQIQQDYETTRSEIMISEEELAMREKEMQEIKIELEESIKGQELKLEDVRREIYNKEREKTIL